MSGSDTWGRSHLRAPPALRRKEREPRRTWVAPEPDGTGGALTGGENDLPGPRPSAGGRSDRRGGLTVVHEPTGPRRVRDHFVALGSGPQQGVAMRRASTVPSRPHSRRLNLGCGKHPKRPVPPFRRPTGVGALHRTERGHPWRRPVAPTLGAERAVSGTRRRRQPLQPGRRGGARRQGPRDLPEVHRQSDVLGGSTRAAGHGSVAGANPTPSAPPLASLAAPRWGERRTSGALARCPARRRTTQGATKSSRAPVTRHCGTHTRRRARPRPLCPPFGRCAPPLGRRARASCLP